jgi:hypothetical protein
MEDLEDLVTLLSLVWLAVAANANPKTLVQVPEHQIEFRKAGRGCPSVFPLAPARHDVGAAVILQTETRPTTETTFRYGQTGPGQTEERQALKVIASWEVAKGSEVVKLQANLRSPRICECGVGAQ